MNTAGVIQKVQTIVTERTKETELPTGKILSFSPSVNFLA